MHRDQRRTRGTSMTMTMHIAKRLCGLLVLACLSSPVWALGLGELDLDSALNERFKANVELFDTAGLEASEIRVALATAEDFERVGVERFFFLTTLKFEIDEVRGKPVIRISSTQPISEPYLNFLIEVIWPSGRMLKEYTVLLDPPTFTQAAAPAVTAPSRDTASSQVSGAIDRGNVNVPSARSSQSSPSGSGVRSTGAVNSDGTYGATGRNDTLWKIASDTLPAADVTVQQNMLAIKRINPEAFIRDNINLLKAGYVLRTPSAADARSIGVEDAKQRVLMENEAWRTGRALPESGTAVASQSGSPDLKAQVDATDSTSTAPAATDGEGKLRIVAEAGDSAQGTADTAATEAAGSVSAEERDRLSRQLEELTYKMDRELEAAGEQVAVKERQLEVKDQEIAELQAQVAAMREQMQQLSAQRAQNQSTASNPDAPWWQSPTVLGGGLGALVLLSVLGLLFARKRRSAAEAEFYASEVEADAERAVADRSEPLFEEDAPGAAEAAVAAETLDSDWDTQADEDAAVTAVEESWDDAEDDAIYADSDADAGYDDEFAESTAENVVGSDETADGQIGDVIGESEIYIAYGRYPQAVNLLTGALAQDPDRHDVRCKLLELYAETNDRESFNSEFSTLQERCDDVEVLNAARELEGRLEEVSAEMALSDDDVAAEPAAHDTPDVDLDLALDTDDSLDDAPTVDLSDASLDADDSGDFELELDDFDGAANDATDLEASASETAFADSTASEDAADALASEPAASDDLGGDLGLDFDPDRDVEHGASVAAPGAAAVAGAAASSAAQSPADNEDLLDLDAILDDNAGLDLDGDINPEIDDEFDFADSEDGASTKLDLAKAYIDMGDEDGARDILNEVLAEGTQTQQQQAQELLENI